MTGRSLFDAGSGSTIGGAVSWLTGTLLGSVATLLCVLAVAVIGFAMLSGRLQIRRGAYVVLGCFVLLGAPIIASAFLSMVGSQAGVTEQRADSVKEPVPRAALPPADYDPYAGASLRQD